MNRFRRLLVGILLGADVQAAGAQTVDQILASLTEISGIHARRPVQQSRMTRAQLRVYFEKKIRASIKPEQMRIEELALKKFGLVPEDYDLRGSLLDLMSEQAAAFYDYDKDQMVMLEGGSGALEQMALVHELAHALADQRFDLGKYMRASAEEGETTMARQAVVEGQAQWLMTEYMARQMGQSLLKSPGLVKLLSGTVESNGQYPVYDKTPQYMRESLVFPYSAGMLFQQAVVAELGTAAFARIFEKPPLNSHEILHPEIYLGRGVAEQPMRAPELLEGKAAKDWKELAEGVVGEFDHQMMLKLYAGDELGLAADWRAAHYRLWEEKRSKAVALTYTVRWSSEEAARRYMAAYRKVLAGKWGDLRIEAEGEDEFRGRGGGGGFEVRRTGATVSTREVLPFSTLKP